MYARLRLNSSKPSQYQKLPLEFQGLDQSSDSEIFELPRLLESYYTNPTSFSSLLKGAKLSELEEIDSTGSDLLHAAAVNGDIALGIPYILSCHCSDCLIPLVRYLLDRGLSPNKQNFRGNTCLHYACSTQKENTMVVKLLLDRGASPNIRNKADDDTPLSLSFRRRTWATTTLLEYLTLSPDWRKSDLDNHPNVVRTSTPNFLERLV